MNYYVPPHKLPLRTPEEPIPSFTATSDLVKITTNSPYGTLDSLDSLHCASDLPFKSPTPIQKYVIPTVLKNHPLMCRAPTGMGKTLCFLLPLVENLKILNGLKICVVAPTRELCEQIKEQANMIVGKDVVVKCLYGGTSGMYPSSAADANILIAAPGKLLYGLNKGILSFLQLSSLVLDEADKLLDMGFDRDLRQIKSYVPPSASVFLFSATFSKMLTPIIEEFLPSNKVVVEVQNETIENIKQTILQASNKDEALRSLLRETSEKIIVFVEKKITAIQLEKKIHDWGFPVVSLHGDKEQPERQRSLNKFKGEDVNILVATSVASRGIDVKDIKKVINYDFPKDIKEYIHRIGRTGRQGKDGEAISFAGTIPEETKNDLVNVLKESKNEVPGFLKDKRSDTARFDRWNKTNVVMKKMKDLSIQGSNQSINNTPGSNMSEYEVEKEDTEEDRPGIW